MILGLLGAFAVWGLYWGGWSALLPAIKLSIGATQSELGLALFAGPVGAFPAMLLMGLLVDRFGHRPLVAALAAFGLAAALPGLVASTAGLAVAVLLLGVTSGALDVALNSTLATLEAERRERLFNKAHAAFPLAAVLASPAVGLAREAGLAPRPILFTLSVLVLASAGLLWAASRGQAWQPAPRHRLRFSVSRSLLLLGGAGALVILMENAVELWSALHLEETLQASPFVGSLGPGLYMLALFTGRLAAQARSGRGVEGRLILFAGLAGATGVGLVSLASRPAFALLGFALAGLGLAGTLPTLLSLAGRLRPAAMRGASISTVNTTMYLGYLFSPPLMGSLAGWIGLRHAWLVLALFGLLLAASSWKIGRLANG